jgi:abhydrolase domain-containing protein 17
MGVWLSGGGHCNLELYPDYIKHLKKFVSSVSKKASSKPDPKETTSKDDTTSKETEEAYPDICGHFLPPTKAALRETEHG